MNDLCDDCIYLEDGRCELGQDPDDCDLYEDDLWSGDWEVEE